jgi:hypothetical protein
MKVSKNVKLGEPGYYQIPDAKTKETRVANELFELATVVPAHLQRLSYAPFTSDDEKTFLIMNDVFDGIDIIHQWATVSPHKTPYDASSAKDYVRDVKRDLELLKKRFKKASAISKRAAHESFGRCLESALNRTRPNEKNKIERTFYRTLRRMLRNNANAGLSRPTKSEVRKAFEAKFPDPVSESTWHRLLREFNLISFLPVGRAGRPPNRCQILRRP